MVSQIMYGFYWATLYMVNMRLRGFTIKVITSYIQMATELTIFNPVAFQHLEVNNLLQRITHKTHDRQKQQ